MRFLALVAAACSLAFVTTVSAQTAPQAMTDVYACAQIQDDAQRLACFDRTVGALQQAQTQGQVVAVDRAQAAEIERDSFGFNLPSLGRLLPDLDGGDNEIDDIQMTVARVSERNYGYHAFVMEDGQVWVQIEPDNARNVRAGDVVTIRRASLGSYRLVSPRGGQGHRVRREN
jgi:hypothetical protein